MVSTEAYKEQSLSWTNCDGSINKILRLSETKLLNLVLNAISPFFYRTWIFVTNYFVKYEE
jgi:hypothetical protein